MHLLGSSTLNIAYTQYRTFVFTEEALEAHDGDFARASLDKIERILAKKIPYAAYSSTDQYYRMDASQRRTFWAVEIGKHTQRVRMGRTHAKWIESLTGRNALLAVQKRPCVAAFLENPTRFSFSAILLPHYSRLPNEVIQGAMHFVPLKDMGSASLACRWSAQNIREAMKWRAKILGYRGDSYLEARQFLIYFFQDLREIMAREETPIPRHLMVINSAGTPPRQDLEQSALLVSGGILSEPGLAETLFAVALTEQRGYFLTFLLHSGSTPSACALESMQCFSSLENPLPQHREAVRQYLARGGSVTRQSLQQASDRDMEALLSLAFAFRLLFPRKIADAFCREFFSKTEGKVDALEVWEREKFQKIWLKRAQKFGYVDEDLAEAKQYLVRLIQAVQHLVPVFKRHEFLFKFFKSNGTVIDQRFSSTIGTLSDSALHAILGALAKESPNYVVEAFNFIFVGHRRFGKARILLRFAIQYGYLPTVRTILEERPYYKDRILVERKTPLKIANQYNQQAVADYLLAIGAVEKVPGAGNRLPYQRAFYLSS